MSSIKRYKLATLTFFQFVSMGAVAPIFSLYMIKYLGFSGKQTGIVMATAAVSSLLSPFFGSFLADRVISAEKLYGILNVLCGIVLLMLRHIVDFPLFLAGYFFYIITIGPIIPLNNAIIFHHLKNRDKDYGIIRVFGTLGWMAAGWIFGWVWLNGMGRGNIPERLPDALTLSGIVAIILGIYAFALPVSGAVDIKRQTIFPKEAFRIVFSKKIVLVAMISFLMYVSDRFYIYGAAPFLKQTGFTESAIMPVMTIGQIPEIIAMILLGYIISRFRIRGALLFGIIFNAIRYTLFVIFGSKLMIMTGIAFHGLAYALFYATVFLYIDNAADKSSRAGVHQIFRVISIGMGELVGNLSAGAVFDSFTKNGITNFSMYWLIPACITLLLIPLMTIALLRSPKMVVAKQ